MSARSVVLVEGESDRCALETLAARHGRGLEAEGIAVVAMGGATNVGAFAREYGPAVVAGLCDAREEAVFRRVLGGASVFVCVEDLEDELIRALGPGRVEAVIEREGELRAFRTLQKQPAHLGGRPERQLRRFIGTHSGRKLQYAQALVDALDLERAPAPLLQLLAFL